MPLLTPTYGDPVTVLASLDMYSNNALRNLANGATRQGRVIDNSIARACDIRIYLQLLSDGYAGGVIDLHLAGGNSYTLLSDGYSGNTLTSASVLSPKYSQHLVSLPITGSSALVWEGSLMAYLPSIPRFFALVLSNHSGGVLNSNYAHKLDLTFVNYEYL